MDHKYQFCSELSVLLYLMLLLKEALVEEVLREGGGCKRKGGALTQRAMICSGLCRIPLLLWRMHPKYCLLWHV